MVIAMNSSCSRISPQNVYVLVVGVGKEVIGSCRVTCSFCFCFSVSVMISCKLKQTSYESHECRHKVNRLILENDLNYRYSKDICATCVRLQVLLECTRCWHILNDIIADVFLIIMRAFV